MEAQQGSTAPNSLLNALPPVVRRLEALRAHRGTELSFHSLVLAWTSL